MRQKHESIGIYAKWPPEFSRTRFAADGWTGVAHDVGLAAARYRDAKYNRIAQDFSSSAASDRVTL